MFNWVISQKKKTLSFKYVKSTFTVHVPKCFHIRKHPSCLYVTELN